MTDRLIAWWNIAHSSSNESDRRVGRSIESLGWQGFVDQQIKPAIDLGVRRVMLHNPFGALLRKDMQFDQYLHAKDGIEGVHGPLPWLVEGFENAWKAITSQGIELICYIGSLRNDPDFDADDGVFDDFDRLSKSTAAIRRSGCRFIVMDATHAEPKDGLADQFAMWLEGKGIKVGCEPRPEFGMYHWAQRPTVCINDTWYRTSPERFELFAQRDREAGNDKSARRNEGIAKDLRLKVTSDAENATAEVILLQSKESDPVASATRALKDGYSVAVDVNTFEKLVQGAKAA
ncbi:MAG: hypothetical protein AAF711_00690 [Planctomycetota bacterium]